ncbi:hypothetical protein QBC46DRAFT_462179 [Diplogelasinospora grovesii]|uniref:Uncharacterized protein n=1 Tax=Diplogelasinospora grovesii TaxID=303347 RepID=A0AAN6S079_9PEZI|nr:hypothetical protein QBC46DRAFT_462179 [Diplogelasinospora grovesii]
MEWLTQSDSALQQQDFLRRRQPGTGQWFLDSEEYRAWLQTAGETLFCPGIPGSGKTILTSIVVDDITTRFRNDDSVGIAYVYCNFRPADRQNTEDLVMSLLKQLAQGQPSLPESVKSLYDRHVKRQTRPSFDEISGAIQSVATIFSRVFLIIDALDECHQSKLLTEMFNLSAKRGANVFVTSRFIPEVTEMFDRRTYLEIRASKRDIEMYLEGNMPQKFHQLQDEIKTSISDAVDGMFRLADIYLRSLDDKITPREVRNALARLQKQSPGSGGDERIQILSQVYEHAMERIDGQMSGFKQLARSVLSWITCAKRPLTALELQHALAVNVGDTRLDEENLSRIEDMISVCAGLVTVDKESIVRFVHYTAQEYFQQTQQRWFSDANNHIASICVTYLSFIVFESGYCQSDDEFKERLRLNPFYDYAAHNWGYHARETLTLRGEVIDFLQDQKKVEASSQALSVVERESAYLNYSRASPRRMTGLHLAAYFGVEKAVNALLLTGKVDVNSKSNSGQTPLLYAAERGHEAVVKLLLDTGKVDINSKSNSGRTPLLYAAERGHEAVVKLLLDTGKVDIESKDDSGRTPLSWAAGSGHEAVVKLLLDTGKVDVESKDESGQTPLSWAAESGHEAVVKLLLDTGKVDINSKSTSGRTPLSYAAERGHEAVVKLLQV